MNSTATSKRAASPSVPAAVPAEKTPPSQTGARELVAELTTTQKSKVLTLLNEGTPTELAVIKGVSKTRAAAIEKARPFESIDEVILVSGIGKKTISEIVSHARGLTAQKKRSSPASSSKRGSRNRSSSKWRSRWRNPDSLGRPL